MNKIRIMAHRGASFHAPENTKAEFLKAYDLKADGIETDLQLTADEEIVIHHNYYIDNTSDGKGAIFLKTLKELKQYDFGSYKGEEFEGERILTLSELLPILKDMKVINLELKSHLDKSVDFAGKVLSIVQKSGLADRVIYSSFDADLLGQLKKKDSTCRVGLLTFQEKMQGLLREFSATFAAKYPVSDVKAVLEKAGESHTLIQIVDSLPYRPDYLHPDYHSVLENPDLVKEMHNRGIGVNPYTCDSAEEMERLVLAGCDGIITNRPDLAAEALES